MKNRSLFILFAVIFVVIAIVGSLYLIPSDREKALTSFKDKKYQEAFYIYEEAYNNGDLSIDTVTNLVNIYEQYAEIEEAIAVMEAFVAKNPMHLQARKKLGKLYQQGQRPEDYLKNLEKMNEIASSPEYLRTLSKQYDVSQAVDKNIPVLLELVLGEGNNPSPQDYRDLALLLASGDDPKQAVKVMEQFVTTKPDDVTPVDYELMLRLYADTQQFDAMQQYAMSLHETPLSAPTIARISEILLYRLNAEAATAFITPYADRIDEHPDLLSHYVTLLQSTGQQKEAYALMMARYNNETLPTSMYDELLQSAALYGNMTLYKSLRDDVVYEALDAAEVASLVEVSTAQKDRILLNRLRDQVEVIQARDPNPYLEALILLADNGKGSEERVIAAINYLENDEQRLQLASLCATRKMMPCVNAYLENVPPAAEVTPAQLLNITQLMQQAGESKRAYAYLQEAKESGTGNRIMYENAWLPLATATQESSVIRGFLNGDTSHITDDSFTNAYYSAINSKRTDNAVAIAEYRYGQEQSAKHREFVTQAYMQAGRYAEALPLLEANKNTSVNAQQDYLFVLTKLAKRDPAYARKLGDYGVQLLNQNVSYQRRSNIIYALVDAGQTARVLPYLRTLAINDPDEWAGLYNNYLIAQDDPQATIAFWQEVLDAHADDIELQQRIAYIILESGSQEQAIDVFKRIAQDAQPGDDTVKQLLYLWGPLYDDAALSWLEMRANNAADNQERAQWIALMAGGLTDEQLLIMAPRYPQLLRIKSTESRYLDALQRFTEPAGRKSAVANYITPRIATSTNTTQLVDYGDLASSYDLDQLSEAAYRRALQQSPEDIVLHGKLAQSYYGRADYSRARDVLDNYFASPVEPPLFATYDNYLPYFMYAELIRREGERESAAEYYNAVVQGAESGSSPDDALLHSMVARSLAYSSTSQESAETGIEYYRQLFNRFPDNRQIRADYSAMLVDIEARELAAESLAQWNTPLAENTVNLMPISLSETGATGYRLISKNSAVILIHEDDTPLTLPDNTQVEWLGYNAQGYGKTLVTANSGYRLEVNNTLDGNTWLQPVLVPSTQQDTLNEEFAIQNELIAARIEVETGEAYASSKRTRALLERHPNNPQVLGFAANVENFIGNWPYARTLINDAHELQPDNEDIIALQRGIEREHAASIYLDGEWRALGDNDEFITTVGATYDVSDNVQIGLEVQNDSVRSDTLRLSDGTLDSFDVERQRGELFARYFDKDASSQLQLSLFANNDTPGAGLYYLFANMLGFTNLGIEYHRPNWEFVEGVIDDATRDRIEIGHRYSPNDEVIITGEAGLNNYNTEADDSLATSVSLNASISKRIHELPYIAVGYNLDAEYKTDDEDGVDANGIPFQRFPLDSREIHSVNIFGNYAIDEDTTAEGLLSYGFDRITGDSGPGIEGRLTHYITDALSVQGRASYGFRGGANENDVTRTGVRLQYRY